MKNKGIDWSLFNVVFDETQGNTFIKNIIEEMKAKKEAFIKEMLIKKGYPELAEINERVRFPKVNRTILGNWEYIFADNGTKNGDFIVAISDWEPDNNDNAVTQEDNSFKLINQYTFKWQDEFFNDVEL